MKKIFLLILITGLFACNKETEPGLIGKWKLIGISGGFKGGGYDANFDFLNIIDEKHWEWLDSLNNTVASGKYSLSSSKGKDCIKFNTTSESSSFYFDTNLEYTFYTSDTIYMKPCFECNDCYDYLFIKEN